MNTRLDNDAFANGPSDGQTAIADEASWAREEAVWIAKNPINARLIDASDWKNLCGTELNVEQERPHQARGDLVADLLRISSVTRKI